MFTKSLLATSILAVAAGVSAAPQLAKVDAAHIDIAKTNVAAGTTYRGIGTVYSQQGGIGSCGNRHSDDDLIVAMTFAWQGNHWPPAQCGRRVRITNVGSNSGTGGKGRSVTALVQDSCPGCPTADSLDLSIGAWNALTGYAAFGTINIEWYELL